MDMNRLLWANASRLIQDRIFWLCMGFMGLVLPVFNGIFGNFFYTLSAAVVPAAFCPLFLGAEYSDGTMRSKIAVGHSRWSVYLADLTICAVAGLLFNTAWLTGSLLFHRAMELPAEPLRFLLCAGGVCLAWTAVFTLISLLIQSKAHAAVACLLTAVVMFLLGLQLTIMINAISSTATSGSGTACTPTPLELFRDILPGGQAYLLAIGDFITTEQLTRFPLYSLGLATVVTIIGLLLFRRKDLK